jgi:dihydroneopterin aldolase
VQVSTVPGRIELRGLRCSNGLLVDVSVGLDLSAVAESDAYADTVDLADLAQTLREALAAPFLLLETAAVHAARAVLQRYVSVTDVELRVGKPEPDGLDAAEEAVGVRLVRPAHSATD